MAPSRAPSPSQVFSYTFHGLLLFCTAVSYRSAMKIIPSCLLTPPSGYSFQPDLICQLCCHQRHPRAHRSGWTLDLHACFPSTQPSPSNPSSRSDYQPSQGTSSNSLKFITQLTCSHIFLSFACGQLRVTRSHFISKELCPVISCPK